ncbi:MAG TPA: pilus assembly protein PilP [Burkholderiales bacterium]
MRAALLLACAFACGAAAQGEVLPKVFVAEIQPGFQPAHALQLDGDTLVYTIRFGADIQTRRITPSTAQWTAFRQALDRQNVWRWRGSYKADVSDSTSWSLKIEYADRSLAAAGFGAGPDRSQDAALPKYAFTRYQLALQDLLGQPFVRRVSPIEVFDVEELRLVATHSPAKKEEQWATFRDPAGKAHRVRVGEPVGGLGMLEKVSRSSVSLAMKVKDADGKWVQQERTVRLARRKPPAK